MDEIIIKTKRFVIIILNSKNETFIIYIIFFAIFDLSYRIYHFFKA